MYGKIIGGIIGLALGGGSPVYALVGIVVGHFLYDVPAKKTQKKFAQDFGNNISFLRYVDYVSRAAAKIAKASGSIKPAEINEIERIFAQMNLSPDMRKKAIGAFRRAKNDGTTLSQISKNFAMDFRAENSRIDYLMILVRIAAAKGSIYEEEMRELRNVVGIFGFPQDWLNKMISDVLHFGYSQNANYSNPTYQKQITDEVKNAYAILGLKVGAPFSEVKSAYRQKCKELHPDVLRSKGLGDSALKVLENELRRVSDAYELIEKFSR